ncbi:hypothetical protein DFP98_11399 [Cohnella phaseoli]|uniref:Uncharacterized protein n=1 Tax=Cohnella phaseoli TaxID=456490 RepID=A0A3D9JQH3_9BACL|nr:hypothetical protein DFP98_11399 [Cohnella phaseoli]
MFNVYALEYLMSQHQQTVEKEARHAWKWINQSEAETVYEVKDIQPSAMCCQPVCC